MNISNRILLEKKVKEKIDSITDTYNKMISIMDAESVFYCGVLFEYARHQAKRNARIATFFSDKEVTKYLCELTGTFNDDYQNIIELRRKAKPVSDLIEAYKYELKCTFINSGALIWHSSLIPNINVIKASRRALNQYKNEYVNGVFGIGLLEDAFVYMLRASGEGMIGFPQHKTYIFSRNPFNISSKNIMTLKNEVFLYQMTIDCFEPVVDFFPTDKYSLKDPHIFNNRFRLLFDDEWIAKQKSVPCSSVVYQWDELADAYLHKFNLFYFVNTIADSNLSYGDFNRLIDIGLIRGV